MLAYQISVTPYYRGSKTALKQMRLTLLQPNLNDDRSDQITHRHGDAEPPTPEHAGEEDGAPPLCPPWRSGGGRSGQIYTMSGEEPAAALMLERRGAERLYGAVTES